MDPNIDLRNLFRNFFGFPSYRRPSDHRDEIQRFEDQYEDENTVNTFDRNPRGFTVYSDPLEIHKYFEQQLDDMLKVFGGFGFGGSINSGESFGAFSHRGMIPFEGKKSENPNDYTRDFMLKDDGKSRVDTEVEWDKVNMSELENIMKQRRDTNDEMSGETKQYSGPFDWSMMTTPGSGSTHRSGSSVFSFGSSMSEKTIRNSNGGLETTRTVRNSDGTESVSVTKQLGDKCYSTTTTTDKSGQSVTEEKLVNITESEIDSFKNSFSQLNTNPILPGCYNEDPRRNMIEAPLSDSAYSTLWDKFFGK